MGNTEKTIEKNDNTEAAKNIEIKNPFAPEYNTLTRDEWEHSQGAFVDLMDEALDMRDRLRGLGGIAWALAELADKGTVTPESLFVLHGDLRALADKMHDFCESLAGEVMEAGF